MLMSVWVIEVAVLKSVLTLWVLSSAHVIQDILWLVLVFNVLVSSAILDGLFT